MTVFRSRDFALKSGDRLAELEIAYERYGELAPDAGNVILVTHGISSSHHGAGPATLDRRHGWWSEVIGPQKVFDTERFCIISSNILGSSYGSTGPGSTDPATGRPYGDSFPDIDFEDAVRAQHLLLESLGIQKLVAVAGNSIGGFQAFQWAVTFPEFMAGVIAMDTGPKDLFNTAASIPCLINDLSLDPNWNGGEFYEKGGIVEAMTALRIKTLKSFGIEEKLALQNDKETCEALVSDVAQEWACEFDPHGLIRLMQAWAKFDVEDQLHKIRAKVLYVLADTDELFPASIGKEVMSRFSAAGVDVTFVELKSRFGHYATTEEPEKWSWAATKFLDALGAR